MSAWKSDVWALIKRDVALGEKVTLDYLYGFAPVLHAMHPDNSAVKAKIRQVCAQLSADGKLSRISPGMYQRVEA